MYGSPYYYYGHGDRGEVEVTLNTQQGVVGGRIFGPKPIHE